MLSRDPASNLMNLCNLVMNVSAPMARNRNDSGGMKDHVMGKVHSRTEIISARSRSLHTRPTKARKAGIGLSGWWIFWFLIRATARRIGQ